ncbi:unnamed protein product, partial [Linum tenue]
MFGVLEFWVLSPVMNYSWTSYEFCVPYRTMKILSKMFKVVVAGQGGSYLPRVGQVMGRPCQARGG